MARARCAWWSDGDEAASAVGSGTRSTTASRRLAGPPPPSRRRSAPGSCRRGARDRLRRPGGRHRSACPSDASRRRSAASTCLGSGSSSCLLPSLQGKDRHALRVAPTITRTVPATTAAPAATSGMRTAFRCSASTSIGPASMTVSSSVYTIRGTRKPARPRTIRTSPITVRRRTASSSRSLATSSEQPSEERENEQDDEDEEQDASDRGGTGGDATEAEDGCHQGDDEEDQRPPQHWNPPSEGERDSPSR